MMATKTENIQRIVIAVIALLALIISIMIFMSNKSTSEKPLAYTEKEQTTTTEPTTEFDPAEYYPDTNMDIL